MRIKNRGENVNLRILEPLKNKWIEFSRTH